MNKKFLLLFSKKKRLLAYHEHGFALLIVLWTLVLLVLVVTHLTRTAHTEAQLAGNLRLASVVQAAADGAVSEAIFHALDSTDRHWPADGAPHRVAFPNAVVELRIDNLAGRVNPNSAQPALLQALLRGVGVDVQDAALLGNAIADWRTPDNTGTGPGRVARAAPYRAAGHDYGPPGAPFETLDELHLVLGMTPEIFARLVPHLSLYVESFPDPRAADPVVQEALREMTGGASLAGIVPALQITSRRAGPFGTRQNTPAENLLAITATASGPDNARFVRRAIVRLGTTADLPFEILGWSADS